MGLNIIKIKSLHLVHIYVLMHLTQICTYRRRNFTKFCRQKCIDFFHWKLINNPIRCCNENFIVNRIVGTTIMVVKDTIKIVDVSNTFLEPIHNNKSYVHDYPIGKGQKWNGVLRNTIKILILPFLALKDSISLMLWFQRFNPLSFILSFFLNIYPV